MAIGTPTTIGTNNAKSSVGSISVTVPAGGVPAGAQVVVGIVTSDLDDTRSVTDTAGNTYALDAQQVRNTNLNLEVFRASNVTALSSGDTVTYTISAGTVNAVAISAFYCTGLATSSPLDGSPVGAFGASASPNSGTLSTANADDLLVGFVGVIATNADSFTQDTSPAFATPPDQDGTLGGTLGSNISIRGGAVAVSSTGSYDYSPTITSRSWVALILGYKAASGGGNTLTADTGSFSLTGNDAALNRALLVAATGAYSLTGNDAALLAQRVISAATGSFSLTGQDAGLIAGRVISAGLGSFSLTGNDAPLLAQRVLTAAGGAFTLTGVDATLTYASVGSFTLTAATGSLTLTGNAAGLLAARSLLAASASFALTGNDIALVRVMTAGIGEFLLTGNDAGLAATARAFAVDAGEFTLTGNAAALIARQIAVTDWTNVTPASGIWTPVSGTPTTWTPQN